MTFTTADLIWQPERLQQAREDAGLSRQELASRVGVGQSWVWRIEHDKAPSGPLIRRLARVLDCRPRHFFADSATQSSSNAILSCAVSQQEGAA